MRIKICGITRVADALAAAEAGADAIGLVFAESPRQVTTAAARAIVAKLPPYVSAVGVFVNARVGTVLRVVEEVGLSEVQLHGDESAEYVQRLGRVRAVKAVQVRDRGFLEQVNAFRDAGVAGILLDAFSATARGGSGKRFDWDLVVGARTAGAMEGMPPLILSGGLTAQNVAAGIRRLRPWGVDVSSGVEESPGIKSAERISQFVAAVRGV